MYANYPYLCMQDTLSCIFRSILSQKAHQKFQPYWLKTFREKVENLKKAQIMHDLCLVMHAINSIFIDYVRITLSKLVKRQSDPLRFFEQRWKK